MFKISSPVDAIVCFAGGLYPETNLPNHLSISRLFQVDTFLEAHKKSFDTMPTVVFCGGQTNYHTGVKYSEPSSDIYQKFFSGTRSFFSKLGLTSVSTKKGICTVTEALGAKIEITKRNWRSVCLNTSKEHEFRTELIAKKVFGPEVIVTNNPYNQPDGDFMNTGREAMLSKAFKDHFSNYPDGQIPYSDDKSFYEEHLSYYEAQRSTIETTTRRGGMDNMAYLGAKERY